VSGALSLQRARDSLPDAGGKVLQNTIFKSTKKQIWANVYWQGCSTVATRLIVRDTGGGGNLCSPCDFTNIHGFLWKAHGQDCRAHTTQAFRINLQTHQLWITFANRPWGAAPSGICIGEIEALPGEVTGARYRSNFTKLGLPTPPTNLEIVGYDGLGAHLGGLATGDRKTNPPRLP
jgi:hypothetical protein